MNPAAQSFEGPSPEEVADLRARLAEASETLCAIRSGEVDAVVVPGPQGDQLFTLKGADAPYRVLIEEMNQGAATLTTDGLILYCNRRFTELLKAPLEEIIGLAFNAFVAPAERAAFAALLEAGRTGGSAGEITLCAGDASPVPLQLALGPLPAESAAAICLVATDISGRKRADERTAHVLRELNEVKAALDEHAIVAITDRSGRITYVNDKFCAISQYSRAELIGRDHRIINSEYHPKEFIRGLWQTIGAGLVWKGEIKNKARDGTFYWVDTTIVPYLDAAGKPIQYIAIRNDITERKRIEHEVEQARDVAVESARMKSEFLANMSHEIRTPMNGIIGMTDLALETRLNHEQRDYLGMVKTSAQSLLRLINDILDFSKIEAGKLELDSIDFTLRDCVGTALKPLSLRAGQKGLKLVADILPDVPDQLVGDPMRLRQILINLADNAIKFTEQGEVVVKVINQAASNGESHLRFSVSDTGIGIPAEKQSAIFEAFAQADGSTTRTYGGTGLGLSIASQLIQKMHGRIWIESKVGEGTTFHFTARLGVGATPSPVKRPRERRSVNLARLRPGLRILVAEDNVINRAVATGILEKQGHTLVHAANGVEALRALRTGTFDLILMDVQMPEMDGFQATRRIREMEAATEGHVPIIAMTAHAMAGDRERCLAAGMDEYIAKPLKKEDVLRACEHCRVASASGVRAQPTEAKQHRTAPPRSVYSRKELLEQCDGDEELMGKLITLFHENTPRLLDDIRNAIVRRNASDLARSAHALLSSLGAFGANNAYHLTRQLEAQAGREYYEDTDRTFAALEHEITEIHATLAAFSSGT